jgi:hypothetical protein
MQKNRANCSAMGCSKTFDTNRMGCFDAGNDSNDESDGANVFFSN